MRQAKSFESEGSCGDGHFARPAEQSSARSSHSQCKIRDFSIIYPQRLAFMLRLTGVSAIAVICFLYAGYVGAAGVWMLVWPRSISTMPGSGQFNALKWVGPYVPLLVGLAWALIGWGLLQLHNWARWVVMLTSVWGIASSLALALVFSARLWWPFLLVGLQITVRLAVVLYLSRASVADRFTKSVKVT